MLKTLGNVAETWNNSPNKELYLPVTTWHNRWTYDQERLDRYNERSWGGGYGISHFDENGNWHTICFMAFKDSFNKWEPIGGYATEPNKVLNPDSMTNIAGLPFLSLFVLVICSCQNANSYPYKEHQYCQAAAEYRCEPTQQRNPD